MEFINIKNAIPELNIGIISKSSIDIEILIKKIFSFNSNDLIANDIYSKIIWIDNKPIQIHTHVINSDEKINELISINKKFDCFIKISKFDFNFNLIKPLLNNWYKIFLLTINNSSHTFTSKDIEIDNKYIDNIIHYSVSDIYSIETISIFREIIINMYQIKRDINNISFTGYGKSKIVYFEDEYYELGSDLKLSKNNCNLCCIL